MFGLVDLTHGYFLALIPVALAIILAFILPSLPPNPAPPVVIAGGLERYINTLLTNEDWVKASDNKIKDGDTIEIDVAAGKLTLSSKREQTQEVASTAS